jgi:hypothetical protein
MPTSFGQFCSRDCQMLAYNSHTQAHRLMGALNTKAQSLGTLVESVAIALKDAANRRLLPSLRNGMVLSILLVGCKDFVEGNVDFFRLYERLVGLELYAPECSFTLEVTLVGPELTSKAPFHHPSGRVTVVRVCGRLQRMFPPDATYNPLAECYVNVGSSVTPCTRSMSASTCPLTPTTGRPPTPPLASCPHTTTVPFCATPDWVYQQQSIILIPVLLVQQQAHGHLPPRNTNWLNPHCKNSGRQP